MYITQIIKTLDNFYKITISKKIVLSIIYMKNYLFCCKLDNNTLFNLLKLYSYISHHNIKTKIIIIYAF